MTRSYTGSGYNVSDKYLDRVVEFGVSNPPSTTSGIGGIAAIQTNAYNATSYTGLMLLFDATQTKSDQYKLRVGIRTRWERI